ncbi:MAG: epoxyqueuosine reductase QueH [Epsilonproteobacteria bacterium]|nr:epoxyqueuosine reductase QueH [Campylobacterota bacterium]
MLVHLCCAVDAGYFLTQLQKEFDHIVAFFYDPNIHPYSEYVLRLRETKRVCDKLGIELIEGEYDYQHWLKQVAGYEDEEEKGDRCDICFMTNLQATAKMALSLNIDTITTSLLMSPKKSKSQLSKIANIIKQTYNIDFIIRDYAKNQGHQAQQQMAKEMKMYRQDYCGCMFALIKQRRDKLVDELFMPITNQILPGSIEEKLEMYTQRENLERTHTSYHIIKENFLNYRLLSAKITVNKEVVDSYILYYSYLPRQAVGRISHHIGNVYYLNRMQVLFIDLDTFNTLTNHTYKTILEIITNPPSIATEIDIRTKLTHTPYNLSPIIILKTIPMNEKLTIQIDSKIYFDTKEVII